MECVKRSADCGQRCERGCEREQVAWAGALKRDAGEQALKVEYARERAPQFFALDQRALELGDRGIALANRRGACEWAKDAGAQQALAHRGLAAVEGICECRFHA